MFDGVVCGQCCLEHFKVSDALKSISPLSQYLALVVPPSQDESTTKRFLPAIAQTKTGKSKNRVPEA